MSGAEAPEPAPARSPRALLTGLALPSGLPALGAVLQLAVVLTDDPAHGVAVHVGPGWTIALGPLVDGQVYDAALAVPAAVAVAMLTGACDIGIAAHHGTVTGSMAGQSVMALVVEEAAERSVAAPSAEGSDGACS